MGKEYRIVRDGYLGFEVQHRSWWWPFWSQIGVNTFPSLERAREFAIKKQWDGAVVEYIGEIAPQPPAQRDLAD